MNNEDIKILEELLKASKKNDMYEGNKYFKSLEYFIKEYQDLKEIEENHRKENGELRERIKELEEENKASKETINILTNKSEKVVDENNISEEEKRVLEAYRNYKEISGSNSWIICNPNTMWSEYFIPISVIQNKIDELKHRKSKNEFEFACKLKGILYLQELLEKRK